MKATRHWTPAMAAALALLLLAGCGSGPGYRVPAMAVEPMPGPQDERSVHLGLIARMQREGAYHASLAHVDAFRQRHGAPAELRLLQADGLRSTGQAEQARQLYEGLLSGPQAAAAWHGLGLIAAARNDAARAEQALLRATELAPLDTDVLGDLGFQRMRTGQLEQARAPLARAAELAPDNTRAIANLALWAMLGGDARQAEAIMQRGQLPEESRQAVYRLADELRQAVRQARRDNDAGTLAPAAISTASIVAPPSMLERFRPDARAGTASQDERATP